MNAQTNNKKAPGPVLRARLWLQVFVEVLRWRAAMIWMFYFTSTKPEQFLK